MNSKSKNKLLAEIERERRKLYDLLQYEKQYNTEKMIQLSQQIDQLISKYYTLYYLKY